MFYHYGKKISHYKVLILSRISLLIPCNFFPVLVFVNSNDITFVKRLNAIFQRNSKQLKVPHGSKHFTAHSNNLLRN